MASHFCSLSFSFNNTKWTALWTSETAHWTQTLDRHVTDVNGKTDLSLPHRLPGLSIFLTTSTSVSKGFPPTTACQVVRHKQLNRIAHMARRTDITALGQAPWVADLCTCYMHGISWFLFGPSMGLSLRTALGFLLILGHITALLVPRLPTLLNQPKLGMATMPCPTACWTIYYHPKLPETLTALKDLFWYIPHGVTKRLTQSNSEGRLTHMPRHPDLPLPGPPAGPPPQTRFANNCPQHLPYITKASLTLQRGHLWTSPFAQPL